MSFVEQIKEATVNGNANELSEIIKRIVATGIPPAEIIQNGLVEAMSIVGKGFQNGEIYLPEMVASAHAMKTALEILKSAMVGKDIKTIATVVIGTVKGDLHDIGKNLVGIMMEAGGCKVIDLGIDVSAQRFIEAVKTHRPHFLGLSALLTTTMPAMKETIETLGREGLREKIKVLVGGAPITQKYAMAIGADGFAANLGEVEGLLKSFL